MCLSDAVAARNFGFQTLECGHYRVFFRNISQHAAAQLGSHEQGIVIVADAIACSCGNCSTSSIGDFADDLSLALACFVPTTTDLTAACELAVALADRISEAAAEALSGRQAVPARETRSDGGPTVTLCSTVALDGAAVADSAVPKLGTCIVASFRDGSREQAARAARRAVRTAMREALRPLAPPLAPLTLTAALRTDHPDVEYNAAAGGGQDSTLQCEAPLAAAGVDWQQSTVQCEAPLAAAGVDCAAAQEGSKSTGPDCGVMRQHPHTARTGADGGTVPATAASSAAPPAVLRFRQARFRAPQAAAAQAAASDSELAAAAAPAAASDSELAAAAASSAAAGACVVGGDPGCSLPHRPPIEPPVATNSAVHTSTPFPVSAPATQRQSDAGLPEAVSSLLAPPQADSGCAGPVVAADVQPAVMSVRVVEPLASASGPPALGATQAAPSGLLTEPPPPAPLLVFSEPISQQLPLPRLHDAKSSSLRLLVPTAPSLIARAPARDGHHGDPLAASESARPTRRRPGRHHRQHHHDALDARKAHLDPVEISSAAGGDACLPLEPAVTVDAEPRVADGAAGAAFVQPVSHLVCDQRASSTGDCTAHGPADDDLSVPAPLAAGAPELAATQVTAEVGAGIPWLLRWLQPKRRNAAASSSSQSTSTRSRLAGGRSNDATEASSSTVMHAGSTIIMPASRRSMSEPPAPASSQRTGTGTGTGRRLQVDAADIAATSASAERGRGSSTGSAAESAGALVAPAISNDASPFTPMPPLAPRPPPGAPPRLIGRGRQTSGAAAPGVTTAAGSSPWLRRLFGRQREPQLTPLPETQPGGSLEPATGGGLSC